MSNPKPTDNPSRVYRGGGWYFTDPAGVRAAVRSTDSPTYRSDDLGFRCALRGRQPVEVKP